MGEPTVQIKKHLYDVAADGVTRFLRYGASAVIPKSEYERLLPLNPQVKALAVAEVAAEEPPPPPSLSDLTSAQLLVRCAEGGITPPQKAKKAELVALLEGAEQEPANIAES